MGEFHRIFADYMSDMEEIHIGRLKIVEEMQRIHDGYVSGQMTRSDSLAEMVSLLPSLEGMNIDRSLIDKLLSLHENAPVEPAPVLPEVTEPVQIGYIYFVAAPEDNRIKIGYSTQPQQRIHSLMTSSAYKLETLAIITGSREQEQAMHQQFAHLRVHREWFSDCAEIRGFVAELQ